ncbi:MAG: hypothetical protein ACYDHY_06500 [Acidiferrobacterales bacterium]
MTQTSFDYESLKVILRDYCLDAGFMQEGQEIEDVLLRFRKRELPTDPEDIKYKGENPKFDIRIVGLRIKFRNSGSPE